MRAALIVFTILFVLMWAGWTMELYRARKEEYPEHHHDKPRRKTPR